MFHTRFRIALALGALAAAFVMIAADVADARSRVSGGSRGTRTNCAADDHDRADRASDGTHHDAAHQSERQFGGRPVCRNSPAAGLMNCPGFMGGLFAGLLGAGLIGLLLGGGLDRRPRRPGLVPRARFADRHHRADRLAAVLWWQRRQPARDRDGPVDARHAARPAAPVVRLAEPAAASAAALARAPALAPPCGPSNPDEIGTTPADFDAFERLLGEVQTAYGAEDIGKLRNLVTPEMLSYYMEDMNANASRGVVNRITDVKLLQGDPAEAWREGDTEYCTVAVRYSLNDEIVDRNSGKVVEGGPDEAIEVWTFMRARGGNWIVSAIQQTD